VDADYSIELGPTAPALELPWKDPEGRVQYVDLRGAANGGVGRGADRDVGRELERAVERIPEARQFPALRRFLVAVNSQGSPWQTAKCDVWTGAVEAAENLYDAEFAQGSYVDVVLAEQSAGLRGKLEVHQQLAKELARLLEMDEALAATAEAVVRRCYFHRPALAEDSDAGYCLTLWVTGYGASEVEAGERWATAMELAAGCLLKLEPREERAQARELS
jgi:hypothetical protein